MRIALISFHFAEYAFRLAEALARDHEVLLVLDENNARNELGSNDEEWVRPNLWVDRIQCRRLTNPAVVSEAMRLAWRVRRFAPEVVHIQDAPRDELMAALPWWRAIPMVLTIHDHVPHTGKDARDRLRMRWYRALLRQHADAVIVHGERIRRETQDLMPHLRGRVHAVAHGVLGAHASHSDTAWERGVLLFFGRVEEYKGLAVLVEAVAILQRKNVPVRVIVAGKGSDLTRHRPQLEKNPLFELHERYIARDEIPGLFRRAQLAVLPYTDATQSGVAAMAMAYGRPVIASDVGSLGEVVAHERNGLLVPPRDARALADAIERVVNDEAFAQRLAHGAVCTARESLAWNAIAQRTCDVYRAAAAGRSHQGAEKVA